MEKNQEGSGEKWVEQKPVEKSHGRRREARVFHGTHSL